MKLLAATVLMVACVANAQDELELDLSAPMDVSQVVVLPPVLKVVTSKQGGFIGFDAKKTTLKWDTAGHKRLVDALSAALDGKVVPAEATLGALPKAELTPSNVGEPEPQSRLARALNVGWVVSFELTAGQALIGRIADFEGKPAGEKSTVENAAGLKQPVVDAMAGLIAAKVRALTKAREEERAAAAAAALVALTPPPPKPVEQVVDAELAAVSAQAELAKQEAPSELLPSPATPRVTVAVGPGMATRSLTVGGVEAPSLAELRSTAAMGMGVMVQVHPLQFFKKTKGRRWSDLVAEVHYRRTFTQASGTGGSVDGQRCEVTEDDFQARGTWRYRLGDHPYVPSVGVGAGFSQEQTNFSCSFPVVSAMYRGADVQLRVRQPLFRDLVSLDVAVGPRLLIGGPDGQPGFSLSGEAWVEARPMPFLFARGGARLSRLQLSTAGLAVVDTRTFFTVELGAYF
jgi:hypothetical protein